MLPFETRFAQQVDAGIREVQQKILANLASGTLLHQGHDAATVGMLCAAEISKVVGLENARAIMQSVHKEMTAPIKKPSKD
jgi:hypothetical protein